MEEIKLLKEISKKIKVLRTAQGLSQAKLANLSELNRTDIARMEGGNIESGITKYWRVATGLGITLSQLTEIDYE